MWVCINIYIYTHMYALYMYICVSYILRVHAATTGFMKCLFRHECGGNDHTARGVTHVVLTVLGAIEPVSFPR